MDKMVAKGIVVLGVLLLIIGAFVMQSYGKESGVTIIDPSHSNGGYRTTELNNEWVIGVSLVLSGFVVVGFGGYACLKSKDGD